jgi:hypothetical protein
MVWKPHGLVTLVKGADGVNKGTTGHVICKRSMYFSVILYKRSSVCVMFSEPTLCLGWV